MLCYKCREYKLESVIEIVNWILWLLLTLLSSYPMVFMRTATLPSNLLFQERQGEMPTKYFFGLKPENAMEHM